MGLDSPVSIPPSLCRLGPRPYIIKYALGVVLENGMVGDKSVYLKLVQVLTSNHSDRRFVMAKATAAKAASKVPPVNFFAKAKAAAPPADAKKKKQTSWVLDGSRDESLSALEADIHTILEAKAVIDTANNKKSLASKRVSDYALSRYAADYASLGVPPETPLIVSNKSGENVTFVVQDRTTQAVISPEQEEALVELLGEDEAAGILVSQETYAFNGDILAEEGVSEALSGAIAALVEEGKLTEEQAGGLIVASTKRRIAPGTVDRLAVVCGRSNGKIEQLVKVLNGSIVTYVKA